MPRFRAAAVGAEQDGSPAGTAALRRPDDELATIPTVYREDLFAGKVVFVSGAGSGIGKAIAFLFARLGATLAICGRKAVGNIAFAIDRGLPGVAHSVASRASVIALSRTLAVEWAQYGIRLNCLGVRSIESTGFNNYREGDIAAYSAGNPMRRVGDVQDIRRGGGLPGRACGQVHHRRSDQRRWRPDALG